MISPPEALAGALENLAERRAELTASQAAHRRAQSAVATARREDTAAIAAALDAGRRRPPRQHEERATKAAQESSLELEVAAERVRTAGERVDAAIEAEAANWTRDVEGAWSTADQRALEAVEALRASLVERNRLLVLRGHIGRIAEPSTREHALGSPFPDAGPGVIEPLIGINNEPVSAAELLDGVAQHIAQTGIERIVADEQARRVQVEREREVQKERDEETAQREADQATRAEARQARLAP